MKSFYQNAPCRSTVFSCHIIYIYVIQNTSRISQTLNSESSEQKSTDEELAPQEKSTSQLLCTSRYLTVKKQFREFICNRLDSLTECKSVTNTVEIFGYTDTSYIDKRAYG